MAFLRVPVATYRVQFNGGFRFADAQALVPYLHALGVTDLYASPVLQSRRGSTHGYDVTDPTRVDTELGTLEEFQALARALREWGMGLLLDIVPNHMSATPENPWWMDVLEHGQASPYSTYFDINWEAVPPGHPAWGKVVLPILGDHYSRVLEGQQLTLAVEEGAFALHYHGWKLPIDPGSYSIILSHRVSWLRERLGTRHPGMAELMGLIYACRRLPKRTATSPKEMEERRLGTEEIKKRLWRLYGIYPEIRRFLEENLKVMGGVRGDPRSFDLLDRLLREQAYRLAHWRLASEGVNYRRFFDINELVRVRVEDPEVFKATHALVVWMAVEGLVTGLRVDHIDGLYDPTGYLGQLQERLGHRMVRRGEVRQFYVVVEKVLGEDEALPQDWPVAGTTGYDFMNALNGVQVDPDGLTVLQQVYADFTGAREGFRDVVYRVKRAALDDLFRGEVRNLVRRLSALAAMHREGLDLLPSELEQALMEVTASLPVYRTYIRSYQVSPRDRGYIEQAVQEARARRRDVDGQAFDFLRRVLLLEFPPGVSQEERREWLELVMGWQQLSGPATAKGLEDTALYVHNPLVSLNEVGGTGRATAVEEFHRFNQARQEGWPHALSATSTHDTKRSEDVRARINVLSEIPHAWSMSLDRWSRWNQGAKGEVRGRPAPSASDEVLLYQTLLGAWPLAQEELPQFRERVKGYMLKAAREAGENTSWLRPDPEYEAALMRFVEALLEGGERSRFLGDLARLQRRVAFYGAINSLGQTLVKISSPGVPDLYQGTETWDFSLVDPDNRCPVDFQRLSSALEELRGREEDLVGLAQELLEHWEDGRVKLFLTYRALNFRRTHPLLFQEGEYLPLEALGEVQDHVLAFARRKGHLWAVAAVPRLATRLCQPGQFPTGRETWGDHLLALPQDAPLHWSSVLTGDTLTAEAGNQSRAVGLWEVFRHFPVALLTGRTG